MLSFPPPGKRPEKKRPAPMRRGPPQIIVSERLRILWRLGLFIVLLVVFRSGGRGDSPWRVRDLDAVALDDEIGVLVTGTGHFIQLTHHRSELVLRLFGLRNKGLVILHRF